MLSTHPLAAARQRVAEIDSAELRRRVAAGARLIDVREPHEFSQGHLHGAINLPLSRLPLLLAEDPSLADLLSRDSDLVIYCRSGGRSAVAACALLDHGCGRVVSLAGGLQQWHSTPTPSGD